jgi:hypothetical protein
MFETIALILGLLWVVGLVSGYTMGGAVHLLLAVALGMVLFRLFKGRKVVLKR